MNCNMTQKPVPATSEMHCSMPESEKTSCCSSNEDEQTSQTQESCTIKCDCDLKAYLPTKIVISNSISHEIEMPIASTIFEILANSDVILHQMTTTHPPGFPSQTPIYLSIETLRI